jgi:Leucine-rich repeat (LRR) protein
MAILHGADGKHFGPASAERLANSASTRPTPRSSLSQSQLHHRRATMAVRAHPTDDDLVVDASGDGATSIEDEWVERQDIVELCLMFNRIQRIEKLEGMSALRRLNLRANRITEIGGLSGCTQLQELELYENQIHRLEGLEGLSSLTVLDVSYNKITRITGLESAGLTSLRKLYLAQNEIAEIEGLANLPGLRLLELGSNKIRRIPDLKVRPAPVSPLPSQRARSLTDARHAAYSS